MLAMTFKLFLMYSFFILYAFLEAYVHFDFITGLPQQIFESGLSLAALCVMN